MRNVVLGGAMLVLAGLAVWSLFWKLEPTAPQRSLANSSNRAGKMQHRAPSDDLATAAAAEALEHGTEMEEVVKGEESEEPQDIPEVGPTAPVVLRGILYGPRGRVSPSREVRLKYVELKVGSLLDGRGLDLGSFESGRFDGGMSVGGFGGQLLPGFSTTRTDRRGRYEFQLQKPGLVELSVQQTEQLPTLTKSVALEPGVNVHDLHLYSGGSIEGVVRVGGVPEEGADVSVTLGRQIREAKTDEVGQYRLQGLPPGEVRVLVVTNVDGTVLSQFFPIEVEDRVNVRRDLDLEQGVGSLKGYVTVDDAPPLGEARIYWTGSGDTPAVYKVVTGTGYFHLPGLTPGPGTLRVVLIHNIETKGDLSVPVRVLPAGTTRKDVAFRSGWFIDVICERLCPGQVVYLTLLEDERHSSELSGKGGRDAFGEAARYTTRLGPLRRGRYTLKVTNTFYGPDVKEVTLEEQLVQVEVNEGETAVVELVLEESPCEEEQH